MPSVVPFIVPYRVLFTICNVHCLYCAFHPYAYNCPVFPCGLLYLLSILLLVVFIMSPLFFRGGYMLVYPCPLRLY